MTPENIGLAWPETATVNGRVKRIGQHVYNGFSQFSLQLEVYNGVLCYTAQGERISSTLSLLKAGDSVFIEFNKEDLQIVTIEILGDVRGELYLKDLNR